MSTVRGSKLGGMGMVAGTFGEEAVSWPSSSLSGCNVRMSFMGRVSVFMGNIVVGGRIFSVRMTAGPGIEPDFVLLI
jgi:hypothetical protein